MADYLALDTTGKILKLLLKRGGKVFFVSGESENTHSERLLPEIEKLLKRADCSLKELGCVGVVTGPGSFTGIRIGVAAAKGLCQPYNIPVVPVNTFMLEAYNEYTDESEKYRACFDAEIEGGGMIPCSELWPLYLQNCSAESEFKFDLSFVAAEDRETVTELEKAYFDAPCAIDFDNSCHACVTAKDRGRLAGYYCFSEAPDFIELLTLCTRREYRRIGLGKLLLENLIERALELKKEKIFLEVRAGNIIAIKLYEKAGFERFSVRKGYYPDGEDAVNMVYCITNSVTSE